MFRLHLTMFRLWLRLLPIRPSLQMLHLDILPRPMNLHLLLGLHLPLLTWYPLHFHNFHHY